jgi:hypothetical protein
VLSALRRLGSGPATGSGGSAASAGAAKRRAGQKNQRRRTAAQPDSQQHSGHDAQQQQQQTADSQHQEAARKGRSSAGSAPLRPLCCGLLSLPALLCCCLFVCLSLCCPLSAAFALLTDLCAQCLEEGLLSVYELTHQQLTADRERQQRRGEEEQQQEEDALFVLKDSLSSTEARGPFTAAELQQAVNQGEVSAQSAVCRAVGSTQWTPLADMQRSLAEAADPSG